MAGQDAEVVEVGDCLEGVGQVVAVAAVVAEHLLPVVESGDAVLGSCTPFPVSSPGVITHDPPTEKVGGWSSATPR